MFISSANLNPNCLAKGTSLPKKNVKEKQALNTATDTALTVCTTSFLVDLATNGEFLKAGALNIPKVLNGEEWRLFTFPFLHANLWHILKNMTSLQILGPQIEKKWGASGFCQITALATTVNALAFAVFEQDHTSSAGFSGATYAFEGALFATTIKEKGLSEAVDVNLKPLIINSLIVAFLEKLGLFPISHIGHLSGFVAGFAYGWFSKSNPNTVSKPY